MKFEFINNHIQDYKDAVYSPNYTVEEFWSGMTQIGKDSNLYHYDCFFFMFFTFLSPGGSNVKQESLRFSNGCIPINEILKKISSIKQFFGKPKVIFIQADDYQLMYPSQGPTIPLLEKRRIPVDADRLIIQSTIPRKATCTSDESGDNSKGSCLVEAFIKVMRENKGRKMDLLSLTTAINKNVRQKILPVNLPYPQISSTFTKFLYL